MQFLLTICYILYCFKLWKKLRACLDDAYQPSPRLGMFRRGCHLGLEVAWTPPGAKKVHVSQLWDLCSAVSCAAGPEFGSHYVWDVKSLVLKKSKYGLCGGLSTQASCSRAMYPWWAPQLPEQQILCQIHVICFKAVYSASSARRMATEEP